MSQQWANRAAGAEEAIVARHLRRLWQVPATQLGVVGWPPTARDRVFGRWHYWWQAHLLDTLVACCSGEHDAGRESLLLHAAADVPRNSAVDESLVYGDHYFFEALLRVERPDLVERLL